MSKRSITGAILLPNESIGTEPPKELPDREQIILIYCRSGNRSKQAAQKLADMGYTNIYEFGGINTWPGEIVTEEPAAGSEMKLMNGSRNHAVKDLSIRTWRCPVCGEVLDRDTNAAINMMEKGLEMLAS